ncbi:MAG: right-handed parallel beta-helix repeat-containing protein [Planctomycetaceae bacterium]|nr:right-handed parallel beta-helix repeat-containing protein [Planctomycetaceae bacterium]
MKIPFSVHHFRRIFLLSLLLFAQIVSGLLALELKNADFQEFDAERSLPLHWNGDSIARCEKTVTGIRLMLERSGGNHSSLNQMLPVTDPHTEWLLCGTISSSTARAGYLQVKFFKNGKELRRVSSETNGKGPTDVRIQFSPGGADFILIQCRVSTDRPVGTSAEFSGLTLQPVPPGTLSGWKFTSGSGQLQNRTAKDGKNEGFNAHLQHGNAERFASVGEDFFISQDLAHPVEFLATQSAEFSDGKSAEFSDGKTANSRKKASGKFEFAARIQADFVEFGGLRVDFFNGEEKVAEYSSPRNRWNSDLCRIVCEVPENANRAVLHTVFNGRQKFFGERVSCSEFYVGPERQDLPPATPPAPELETVPGFASASIYLHHCRAVRASDLTAELKFRKVQNANVRETKCETARETKWETARETKWETARETKRETARETKRETARETDARKVRTEDAGPWIEALPPVYVAEERDLRGILADLEEDTLYEFRLTVKEKRPSSASGSSSRTPSERSSGGETSDFDETVWIGTFRTQSVGVPVWKTVELGPENCRIPFIPENGSAEKGSIRYVAEPGFVLDAGESAECAVWLEGAEYVILDGLTIRGGHRCGILMDRSRNIQVRNCDIAEFGLVGIHRPDLDGKFYLPGSRKALNTDCGIRISSSSSILVERCFIHDPRATANSWFYSHPAGPNAIFIGDTEKVCIRWNDFVGSDLHRWNDAVEGAGNGSNSGSVRRDAEIYGNYFAFGNDDGMELDGGQINCRFFMNLTEGQLCGVSTAPCKRGPCYLFRNVFAGPGDEFGLVGAGFKNNYQNIGAGSTFFIQNSILGYGTAFSSPGGTPEEYAALADRVPFKGFARNNLALTSSCVSTHFFQNMRSDFDWNLYLPRNEKEFRALQERGQETHSQLAEPQFLDAEGGIYALTEDSPGRRAGTFVPNFTPWESPDLGAIQPGILSAVPHRPLALETEIAHLTLRHDGKTQSGTRTFEVRNLSDEPISFTIVQPEGANAFRVRPDSGTLQGNGSLKLTVEVRPENVRQARKNSSAFLIRTADGLSRPVSVTVDSREHAALLKKDRENAVYGVVRPVKDGAEVEFSVPRDGDYWLFVWGPKKRWKRVRLDGQEPKESISLAPPGDGELWQNVAPRVFNGNANRPYSLKAGTHVFLLEAGAALEFSNAALCEDPDAFRLAPKSLTEEEMRD